MSLRRRMSLLEESEGEEEMYTVILDETVETDDNGITFYEKTDINLENYSDIYIYIDRTQDTRNTGSSDLKITLKTLGFLIFQNVSVSNPKDSYRDLVCHVVNLGNDNLYSEISVANNHANNPANVQMCNIGDFLNNYSVSYANKILLNFNQTYIGTFRIRVIAK